nr:MFS transporter [uncultured Desulfobulbus sp.]
MTSTGTMRPRFHYGWVIVVVGSLGIFACIGLARFALGMLLPSMGADLKLSYSQMGTISTANFIGYLAGILVAAPLVRRIGPRVLTTLALLLSGLSMIVIGFTQNFYGITGLYILTGIGTALANIPIMGLLSAWFASHLRGKAAGFVVSGNGAAIVVAGLSVPWLNGLSDWSWRLSWLVLGSIVCLTGALCLLFFRNRPQELGLEPAGALKPATGLGPHQLSAKRSVPFKLIVHCGLLYAIFGFTFVSYATFIVTAMVRQYGLSQEVAGSFWSWVGFFSLFSGPLLGMLADRFSRPLALMTAFGVQCFAYLLVGLNLGSVALYLSIFCYGIVAWGIPSIMAALSGDYAGADKVVSMFSAITLFFAGGQVAGPYLAGQIAEQSGSFSGSFLLAATLTGLGFLLALMLPKPEAESMTAGGN